MRYMAAGTGLGVLALALVVGDNPAEDEPRPARSYMTYEEMKPYFVKVADPVFHIPAGPNDFPETQDFTTPYQQMKMAQEARAKAGATQTLKKAEVGVPAEGTVIPVPEDKPFLLPPDDKVPVPTAKPDLQPERRLKIYNTHTKERVDVVFKRGDVVDPKGVEALRDILKDHRQQEKHDMDPALFELLADIADELRKRYPKLDIEFQMVSGYRSPITNKKLQDTVGRGGQADNSSHMRGMAMDIRVQGVPRKVLRDIAWCMGAGGVGDYPGDDFVHVDVWDKKTKDKRFPGGERMRAWGWTPDPKQCKPKSP